MDLPTLGARLTALSFRLQMWLLLLVLLTGCLIGSALSDPLIRIWWEDTPSPSTARTPAPLLPTPGDSITWGEAGPCYTLDAVQPSSDGHAWVWMHHCGRPSEKPTILTVEEWRRHALPRATTPTHIED